MRCFRRPSAGREFEIAGGKLYGRVTRDRQVKPEHVKEFLEVVRYDAEHSEKDEPGCLRFDVIQDKDEPNRFFISTRSTGTTRR